MLLTLALFLAVLDPVPSPAPSPAAAPPPPAPPVCTLTPVTAADVFGTPLMDKPLLRTIRLVTSADAATRAAAIAAAQTPVDPGATAAIDKAVAGAPCSSARAELAAARMTTAADLIWNVADPATKAALDARFLLIARSIAARILLDDRRIDALVVPYGTSSDTLTAPTAGAVGVCTKPDAIVSVVHAQQPGYPTAAKSGHTTGSFMVKVATDDDGDVVSATLTDAPAATEPGPRSLQTAAIVAAGTTLYAPGLTKCSPQGGSYLFRADFTGN